MLVLLSPIPEPLMIAQVAHLLAQAGTPPERASEVAQLVVPKVEADSRTPLIPAPPRIERVPAVDGLPSAPSLRVAPAEPPTPAQTFTRTTEVPRHARFLVASAKRFQANPEPAQMQAERRYLAQHLAAVHETRAAARRVDLAVQRYGTTTLGWWAHMDQKTTPECRAANGANFDAARPPMIGYPGTLHGGTCRCHAGPAHDTALTVDQATKALRANQTLPFAAEIG